MGATQSAAAKVSGTPASSGAPPDSPKKDSKYWEEDFIIGDSSSDESEEDLTEDWLSLYSQDEKLGPPVPEAAANLTSKVLRASMSLSRGKELTDKHLRPGNVPALQVPKVKLEIWRSISR